MSHRRRFLAAGIVLTLFACSAVVGADEPKPAKIRTDLNGDPLPEGAVARFGKPPLLHNGLRRLEFAPDGKTLATSGDGPPRVWDLASGRTIACPHLADSDGGLLSFAPDGMHIVGDHQGVRIVDPRSGKVRFVFRQGDDHPRAVVVSADGTTLVVDWGKNLTVYDLAAGPGREPRTLEVDGPESLSLSADGSLLACVEHWSSLVVWDVRRGTRLPPYDQSELPSKSGVGMFHAVALSPDGKKLAAAASTWIDERICIWDTAARTELPGFLPPLEECRHLRFSADGAELLGVACSEKEAVIWTKTETEVVAWSVATGQELRRRGKAEVAEPELTALAPDGKTLAQGRYRDDPFRVIDLTTNKDLPGTERFSELVGLRWLGPDRLGVLEEENDRVFVWAREDGRLLHEWRVPGAKLLAPDGKRVGVKIERSFALRDPTTGQELLRFLYPEHAHEYRERLTFSPDGKLLFAPGGELGSALWEVATGKLLRKFAVERAQRAVFAPDSRTVIVSDGRSLSVAEAASGRVRSTVLLPTDQDVSCSLAALRSSRDGRTLAAFRYDETRHSDFRDVCVYSLDRRRVVLRLEGAKHKQETTVGDLSPDGRWLARGFFDGARHGVLLYDLEAPNPEDNPRTLEGHALRLESIAFSPDGQYLATAGEDGTALVWDLRKLPGASKPAPGATARLESQWKILAADDAEEAGLAMAALERLPEAAVPFLKARLPVAEAPDAARVRKLLAHLEAENFETRDRADRELEGLAELVELVLRAAAARKPNLEVASRIQRLLDRLDEPLTGERLRHVRAVELLERIGTPEAVELLKALAGGAPAARLTREAKAALERLSAAGAR